MPFGLGGRLYQLIRTANSFALATVLTGSHVYEWNEAAQSWDSVCSMVGPISSGTIGVALAEDGHGKYLLAGVNSGAGTSFVERTPTP